MKSPKISIVIPSFNKVKFIGETLESIVKQKYQNYEVIIQDGGSTDGSVEIINKYIKKYPKNIKWESKKDKGQLDAINTGLRKSTGDILTFINADDVYEPGTFESVAEAYLKNNNSLWFAGRGGVINVEGKKIAKAITWYKNLFLAFNSYFLLLTLNYLMQPSVFLTRSAWQKFGPFTGTPDFVTEYDLWLRMAKNQMPIVSDKYFSGFRIESSTITKMNTIKLLSEDEKIVRKYTSNQGVLFLHKLNNFFRIIISVIV